MYTIRSTHGFDLDEPLTLPVSDPESWAAAEEMGVDLAMLFESACATPNERIQAHSAMLRSTDFLKAIPRITDGRA